VAQQLVAAQSSPANLAVNGGDANRSKVLSIVSPGHTGAQVPALMVGVVTPGPPQATTTRLRRFVARPGSKVRIEGTSNIHDWQVEGGLISGALEAGPGFPADEDAARPARGNAFISVRSLKSVQKDGKPYSDRMDEVMYECLKAQAHSKILYALSTLTPKGAAPTADGAFAFDSVGTLAVAGVTNTIEMPVTVTPLPDNRLRVKGSTSLKMTAFGIEPPAPNWLGSVIKTSDEVKLFFEWTLGDKTDSVASAY
jgi:hypothetical protein